MTISISELKTNPQKYFEIAKQQGEIVILKRGERIGRIISEETAVSIDKRKAFDALMAFSNEPPTLPSEYADPRHDPKYALLREEAYRERGLL
jgi:prevent-host-death family protein